jgi:hypothetical protein
MLAYPRDQDLSECAVEALDKALPRWNVDRIGPGDHGPGSGPRTPRDANALHHGRYRTFHAAIAPAFHGRAGENFRRADRAPHTRRV